MQGSQGQRPRRDSVTGSHPAVRCILMFPLETWSSETWKTLGTRMGKLCLPQDSPELRFILVKMKLVLSTQSSVVCVYFSRRFFLFPEHLHFTFMWLQHVLRSVQQLTDPSPSSRSICWLYVKSITGQLAPVFCRGFYHHCGDRNVVMHPVGY